ncbi:MAG TPA: type II CAAX endopeptidase family protein [Candidatus Acidoferrales bacterium]|nr:type II CAAX endopeptidase family protein [Candidatus Acidoferrales bacterium]
MSLPPDNLPASHGGQAEEFSPGASSATQDREPRPEFALRPFDIQGPLPPARADARTPFHWADLIYLMIFYFAAGGVLTLIVAAGAFVFFGISPATLKTSTADWASVLIISQALLSAATLGFLYVMVRGRSAAPFWQTMGWRGFRDVASKGSFVLRYVFAGFALAAVVGWLGNFVGRESGIPMEELFRSRQSVLMLMGLGILIAPVVEETIFRGCIYPVIARRFGITAGIVATGTLFGLAHAQQLGGAWGQIGLLICVGIVLTYIRARAGTVAASYFVHLGYNTILFAGFYIATGGLRHLPGA